MPRSGRGVSQAKQNTFRGYEEAKNKEKH